MNGGAVVAVSGSVKVLYFDGEGRPLRQVVGEIQREDDHFVTIKSGALILTIGKRYVVKIEAWEGGERR